MHEEMRRVFGCGLLMLHLAGGLGVAIAGVEGHPGNVYVGGEVVGVQVPEQYVARGLGWRLMDERGVQLQDGKVASGVGEVEVGTLGVGWYRVEFVDEAGEVVGFTTAAVVAGLEASVAGDSPVCVDTAAAWFARDDEEGQARLAHLASLAGVSWVRDRAQWSELQPARDQWATGETTYDTSARVHAGEGLGILQVFHDTPVWARQQGQGSGRFAPDLRDVYAFARGVAQRFRGRVGAWEPWNEGNVATFGGHTVDEMCSWQKAAWLGFKSADAGLVVGWNATAAVPTDEHTRGLLLNEVWPYFDTYNIHSYDWAHGYEELWKPAREAASGRPIWVTEADRGTRHDGVAPFYDQDERGELLKAEWMAQAYAQSVFAGSRRHFHFILGHYHEPNGVQFGLLRLDLTPRPAYVALAAVGRYLAGAEVVGRWQARGDLQVYVFRARPGGEERDVAVVWAEREVDWPERGQSRVEWDAPEVLREGEVWDYLGRRVEGGLPSVVGSAPYFVVMDRGSAGRLPLEDPPGLAGWREGGVVPVVLQVRMPGSARVKVEDRPWSEGHAYGVELGEWVDWDLWVYNFGEREQSVRLEVESIPEGWEVELGRERVVVGAMGRQVVRCRVRVGADVGAGDGWVVVCGVLGGEVRSVVGFRCVVGSAKR
jgi:hypothetical protein